jgi:hypothetical protein
MLRAGPRGPDGARMRLRPGGPSASVPTLAMRRVGAVLLALVVLAVVSGALLGRLAPRLVAGRLSTTLGLPVEVGRVEAEWETRSLVLSRVEVRAHDGDALVRARSVVVGMAALAGAADAFDGATARGLVLPGLAAVDGSARRLRLQRSSRSRTDGSTRARTPRRRDG